VEVVVLVVVAGSVVVVVLEFVDGSVVVVVVAGVVVFVVVVLEAEVSGLAAGAGVAVVVVEELDDIVDDVSLLDALPFPLPQEATKRPIESANTLNFTNFIKIILVYC